MLSRRLFLSLLLAAMLQAPVGMAWASDDDSGGNSGSGSGNSGSGSGNSGSGSPDDDGDDDEGDEDGKEQDKARKAVASGDAIQLRKVLTQISKRYPGKVVSVLLSGKRQNLSYRVRIISNGGRLINLVVNAKTGQVTSITGD